MKGLYYRRRRADRQTIYEMTTYTYIPKYNVNVFRCIAEESKMSDRFGLLRYIMNKTETSEGKKAKE